jgi:hypothetical protein
VILEVRRSHMVEDKKDIHFIEIFRHRLLENAAAVGGYHEFNGLQEAKDEGAQYPSRDIQTAKNVFLGYLESLVGADESNFPEWFKCINARWIKHRADFDWEDGKKYHRFYKWMEDYIEYLQDRGPQE